MRRVPLLKQAAIHLAAIVAGLLVMAPPLQVAAREAAGRAQVAPAASKTTASRRTPSGQYAIEFRSRQALTYGHTFAVYGRIDGRGQILNPKVAGLHPSGDSGAYTLGHFVPVPAETGASEGDLDPRFVSARYRVVLSEAQYRAVEAHIDQLKANSPTWNALSYNCNSFVADIARFMGLQTPSSTLLMPQDFVNSMRELNSGA